MLRPDTSAAAIRERAGLDPVTHDEFEQSVRSPAQRQRRVGMPASRGHATGSPVYFDELAFAEDISHATTAGRRVAIDARRELERDVVDTGTLQRCQAPGRDATRLERGVKLHLPSTGGPWRMVFEITRDRASGELVLAYSRSASDIPASCGSHRPTKSRTNGFTPASQRPPIAKTLPRTVVLGHAQPVMAGRHCETPVPRLEDSPGGANRALPQTRSPAGPVGPCGHPTAST